MVRKKRHKRTEAKDEIFDVVDKSDRVTGQMSRRKAHSGSKLLHRSVGVFVFNKNGEILLQKRSLNKDTDPGKWTGSASGHVIAGHEYKETAKREMLEEIGIEGDLEEVAKFIVENEIEREITVLYKALAQKPLSVQKDEIDRVEFFSKNKVRSLYASKKLVLTMSTKIALEKIGWL